MITLTQTQQQSYNAWKETNRAVIILPTGMGKTVIAMKVLENPDYKTVCIVVPTKHLQKQWKDELLKHDLLDHRITTVETIQSLHKYKNMHYDILIYDEAHHSVSEKWLDLLNNNKFDNILMLTATLDRDDNRQELLKKYNLQIIQFGDYQNGIQENLVSNYEIINIPVNLEPWEEENLKKINLFINNNFKTFNNNFNNVKLQIKTNTTAQELMRCFLKRKEILNNAISKLEKTYKILSENDFTKAIIFTEYIEFADKIYQYLLNSNEFDPCLYHSKIKTKAKNLQLFKDGTYNIIICAKALDEGLNTPEADLAIIVSASSQQRQTIQRIGRVLRYQENKSAKIFNLYVNNSKEEEWLNKRTRGL